MHHEEPTTKHPHCAYAVLAMPLHVQAAVTQVALHTYCCCCFCTSKAQPSPEHTLSTTVDFAEKTEMTKLKKAVTIYG